jgi:hypothetical protein
MSDGRSAGTPPGGRKLLGTSGGPIINRPDPEGGRCQQECPLFVNLT